MFRGMIKALRSLTIRQKLIFTICGGTLLTIVLTSAIIFRQVSSLIERELIHKGVIIAVGLSKQSIDPILHDDVWELYKAIIAVTGDAGMPYIKYIIILDKTGRILAHSHPRHFRVGAFLPEGPFNERALDAEKTVIQSSPVSRNENLYDIAVPCMVGTEKVGLVRLGMTDHIMRKELAEVKKDVFFFALLLSLAGTGVGLLVAYRIIDPLKRVTQNIENISRGKLRDVFPVKTAEKDEIGRMVDIFNEMAKNLKTRREMDEYVARKDKLVTLGEFSAGLAHEIKNPLTSIKMLMQSAKEGGTLSAGDIEVIEGEINRIDRIVRDFLAFGRPAKAEYVVTDVNAVLREVITLIRSEMDKHHIRLVDDLAANIPAVMAQPDGIKQVILNVVLNALEAMENGGMLKMASFSRNGSVFITVADTGPGIAAQDVQSIFEPFFTTKQDGTGMGLAIADRIIREHNGRIDVETTAGKGTTISIVLPIL